MRAADTNIVVRVLVRDEARQVRQAEAFVAGGAWISHLVLAEAIWVLVTTYRLPWSDVADTIEKLLNHQEFVLEDPPTVSARARLLRLPHTGDRSQGRASAARHLRSRA